MDPILKALLVSLGLNPDDFEGASAEDIAAAIQARADAPPPDGGETRGEDEPDGDEARAEEEEARAAEAEADAAEARARAARARARAVAPKAPIVATAPPIASRRSEVGTPATQARAGTPRASAAAPRRAFPTTRTPEEPNALKAAGLPFCADPQVRSALKLPKKPLAELPSNRAIDAFGNVVFIRNDADRIQFNKARDVNESFKQRYTTTK